jgi:hypothetical protein
MRGLEESWEDGFGVAELSRLLGVHCPRWGLLLGELAYTHCIYLAFNWCLVLETSGGRC